MSIKEKIKEIFKPKLKLLPGTRLTSFLFIAASIAIAFGILFAANIYYNIDTGEIVTEENIFSLTAPSGQSRELRFTVGNYYIAFKATTTLSQTSIYTLPSATPTQTSYLRTDATGQLTWFPASAAPQGTLIQVGDVPENSERAFHSATGSITYGNILWFHPNANYTMALTADSNLTANATTVIPAVSGTNYLALGTGTTNYVAYWSSTNTLTGEPYLSTSRGGTGTSTSAWSGMVKIVNGTWGTTQGTTNYAAYWLDANTVAAEQYLNVTRGGTGRGSWTQWGVLYADTASSLTNTAAGTVNYVLTGAGSAAPTWTSISSLVEATNGLTKYATGTNQIGIKLGGTLSESTTLTIPSSYDLIFNLTGTGDFRVQATGTDIFVVTDNGRVYYKGYPTGYAIAEPGKEILVGMVPIMGFDLPVKTATTTYVKISRDIVNYPLNPCATGTTRVHKLVIRYGSTGSTNWDVATSTGSYPGSSFTLPASGSTTTGSVYTATTTIPTPAGSCTGWTQGTDTEDWWVRVNPGGNEIMIYQIFLAAFDQIQ